MLVQEQPKLIGSVAKESGVPIKTIRYYEELGLLKAVGRTEGGYRLFNSDIFARLNFIKRAQSLGLSLAEIKEFLDVHDGGDLPCDRVKILTNCHNHFIYRGDIWQDASGKFSDRNIDFVQVHTW